MRKMKQVQLKGGLFVHITKLYENQHGEGLSDSDEDQNVVMVIVVRVSTSFEECRKKLQYWRKS